MRDDFCAFILTNRRPNHLLTLSRLRGAGYTGKVYLVLDDEDDTIEQYRQDFPSEEILVFSKAEIAKQIDVGDNFPDRRSVIYARNACWSLARKVGVKYFVELDDDYGSFYYRQNSYGQENDRVLSTMDLLLSALVDFLDESGALSVALSQGGDHIGGVTHSPLRVRRKAMNSFVCRVDRPFSFVSRLNDDVSTYLTLGAKGALFFTTIQVQLNQIQTQKTPGGLTEAYLDFGTYAKSFYSVMYAPSCVKIAELLDHRSNNPRIHHQINWNNAVPKILRERP